MCMSSTLARRPHHLMSRLKTRNKQHLMMAACVLKLLEDKEDTNPMKGRLLGSNNIRRIRKTLDGMWAELGGYARKAYRMSLDSFLLLHETLEPKLREEFDVHDRSRGRTPNGDIPTKLRLSAALRFFSGGAVYDIMLTHGMSRSSVYKSAYGVVNVVNDCPSLSFNENSAEFPSHAEQEEIAAGFLEKSAAGFDKVILALDGMLVWTIQPSRKDCEYLKIGERMFHCYRKDKFGYLLMAGCDHKCKFRWADIRHPGACSDYLAWITSDVGKELESDDSDLVLPGHSIVGDNAFVENNSMSTPIPGINISKEEDAYNFYLSQLRITIERAFGILVHRWGILRRPFSSSILKVPAIVSCLMRLHNFCIDTDSRHTPSFVKEDEIAIQRSASRKKGVVSKKKHDAVTLDKYGSPAQLLGSGHHFKDEPGGSGRRPVQPKQAKKTPMREMMQQVAELDLKRPDINKY